ncbi:hypothetical protein ACPB67_07595 [Micromonospora taraxaci]|uniref:hypothetical protein n=1 Tax=Micromonospora taraxaci TaxID=1316803 RepID=UPI003C30622F
MREQRVPERFGVTQVRQLLPILRSHRYDPVLLDFSDCRDVAPLALIHLIAAVRARSLLGLITTFRLPSSPGTRWRLQEWGFAAALERAANAPMRLLVAMEDIPYLDAPRSSPRLPPGGAARQVLQFLETEGLFGLVSYPLGMPDVARDMANAEITRWSSPLALALFERSLKGDPQDVARVLVQELVINLSHRQDARMTVIASEMHLPENRADVDGQLVIAAWDDGEPITAGGEMETDPLDAFPSVVLRPMGPATSRTLQLPEIPAAVRQLIAAVRPRRQDGGGAESYRRPRSELPLLLDHVVNKFAGTLMLSCAGTAVRLRSDPSGEASFMAQIVPEALENAGNLIVMELPAYASSW